MKRTRSKKRRGLVTRRILYLNRQHPHDRPHELKVDLRRGEEIDNDYATAMVAVRTGLSLENVQIVEIREPDE
ncbi:MAG TPA: hypothetical protein VFQ77_08315 [Pseudonocardiaceae bacterium]|nr:hypothetical protein [Pseudonocardiaceae bacterium]